jgi:hypothetical protein
VLFLFSFFLLFSLKKPFSRKANLSPYDENRLTRQATFRTSTAFVLHFVLSYVAIFTPYICPCCLTQLKLPFVLASNLL